MRGRDKKPVTPPPHLSAVNPINFSSYSRPSYSIISIIPLKTAVQDDLPKTQEA